MANQSLADLRPVENNPSQARVVTLSELVCKIESDVNLALDPVLDYLNGLYETLKATKERLDSSIKIKADTMTCAAQKCKWNHCCFCLFDSITDHLEECRAQIDETGICSFTTEIELNEEGECLHYEP